MDFILLTKIFKILEKKAKVLNHRLCIETAIINKFFQKILTFLKSHIRAYRPRTK